MTVDLSKNVDLNEIYNSLSVQTLVELNKTTGDTYTVNNGKITEVNINEIQEV